MLATISKPRVTATCCSSNQRIRKREVHASVTRAWQCCTMLLGLESHELGEMRREVSCRVQLLTKSVSARLCRSSGLGALAMTLALEQCVVSMCCSHDEDQCSLESHRHDSDDSCTVRRSAKNGTTRFVLRSKTESTRALHRRFCTADTDTAHTGVGKPVAAFRPRFDSEIRVTRARGA